MMYKSFKYRIYPNDAQKELLEKHFNSVRFVYNLALETKIEAYKRGVNLTRFDLQRQLTGLKYDCKWLNEISIGSLQHSINHMDLAFKNFFNGNNKFPVFKKKSNAGSYRCTNSISISDNKLFIPKFRAGIPIVQTRVINGDIKFATVSKTHTNKYFVSIAANCHNIQLPIKNNAIGIDLGVKTFLVTSDGKEYTSPKFMRNSLDRLKVLQRRSSKKKLGSKNRAKANLKLSLLHEHISNQRVNFLHNVSHEITNQNGIICIEDLNVKGMLGNHKLALSISDAGWSLFTNMLKYKCEWRGRKLITIGRFDASTKICSNCGSKKNMPLSERIYNCSCGLSMDRDLNAAINIKNLGILHAVEPVEQSSIDDAMKQEKSRTLTYKLTNL